ncbi:MAG: PH domain-containing protein [Caulobacteraceae bacterium]|nr:PH domain-containing protein [Caulobacteraceae bacterium]
MAAFGPAGLAIGGCIASSLTPDGPVRSGFLIVATVALAAVVCHVLATWAKIRATQIVVTNRRVIYASGVLSRRSIEMNRDKVESVVIDQSVAGRLLDFGTVVIRGVGAGLEPVANVIAPLELRRWVDAE